MIILTAANSALPSDDQIRKNPNFSFRSIIEKTVAKAIECGYTPVVYDLGGLGIGEKFVVEDESFAKEGFYKEVRKGYKSKSLFKPDLVKHCLETHKEFTVYVDGDAQLCDNIDEVLGDYDVGVTLRRPSELKSDWYEDYGDIAGYVNAGVIFFNATPGALKFVDAWLETTIEVGNDQKALNKLVSPDKFPEVNSILTLNNTRIKFFPANQYNYYYFMEGLEPNIKIMHFKGDVRHYYPFDKKKRFFCSTIIPILNKIKPIIKGMIGREK
jgi:hypothetical protein